MKRIAFYYRVSTEDQTVENQRPECEALARARGWLKDEPYIIEETASGAARRAGWARVLELGQKQKIHHVVAWSLDRVGRSLWGISDSVRALDRLGAPLVTVKEPWLEIGSAGGDHLLAEYMRVQMVNLFAFIAEYERRRLIDRTIAGQARGRRNGRLPGRPRTLAGPALDAALSARLDGRSWGEIRTLLIERFGKKLRKGSISRSVSRLQSQLAS
jgi:DNA invertase Pin-like site-specific DNA recombinase